METTQKEENTTKDHKEKSRKEKILRLKNELEESKKEIEKHENLVIFFIVLCIIVAILMMIYGVINILISKNFIIVCENEKCYTLPQTKNGLNDYNLNYPLEYSCVYEFSMFHNKNCISLLENSLGESRTYFLQMVTYIPVKIGNFLNYLFIFNIDDINDPKTWPVGCLPYVSDIEREKEKEKEKEHKLEIHKEEMEIIYKAWIEKFLQFYGEYFDITSHYYKLEKMIKSERSKTILSKKECYTNSDCHLLEKCNEDYKCVIDNLKKAPERVLTENGYEIKLNDGECMINRDCAGNKLSKKSDKFMCNKYYECVPISSKK